MGKRRRKEATVSAASAPLWCGPLEDGITQSMLQQFLTCRERFRLLTVEGLRVADSFRAALEYGQMWHECEEALAAGDSWMDRLRAYAQQLSRQYGTQGEEVDKWYNVCRVQFPLYVRYWKRHWSTKGEQQVKQEEVFCEPYHLPSGREVLLRGKWDGVVRRDRRLYLQENKTKGDINEQDLKSRLTFDLQSMFYLLTLTNVMEEPVAGVIYNVVRRPLSGGRGSIRPHKATKTKPAETKEQYYRRLQAIIKEEPDYFFMRWQVEVSTQDLTRFEETCLIPLLEQLCDWWEWITADPSDPWRAGNQIHWRFPYGVWNPLTDGRGKTDLDDYLETGSKLGLVNVTSLFSELS